MEQYYTDERILKILDQSDNLLDILNFVEQIGFEIKDNLGFDVLWDSLTQNRYIYIYISLLEWLGYSGPKELQKQAFLNLLDRNNINYQTIGYQSSLIEQFPEIEKELLTMRAVDKPRKRWIIMETKWFKKAIMKLNTKRRDDIQDYYLLLEELVKLYGAYTAQFKIKQEQKYKEELKDHILLLKDLLIDDTQRPKTQIIYIATSRNYASQNRFKVGGVESIEKLSGRFSTYNGRSASGDEFYYSDTFLVADYRQIESRLKDLLGRFRDKKSKEMYIIHYTNIRYIVDYLCSHYSEEVDEVNAKLAEFISNLNTHMLRPVVPPPSRITYANVTTLKDDGSAFNKTFVAKSSESFIEQLREYVSGLDESVVEISKKKVFDDLQVKKDRKDKFPILKSMLEELRPEIKLTLSRRH